MCLLPSIAQAAGCSPNPLIQSNESILSLYSPTNSHVALWNDSSGTGYEVCFDQLFGYSYASQRAAIDPSENVHACKPGNTNVVVWLVNRNNSHASQPSANSPPGYPVPVCYGNLQCEARSASLGCRAGYKEVISLAYPTNAHAELNDSNSFVNPTLICCSDSGVSVSSAQWQDSFGNPIGASYGRSSTVNKTVRMVAPIQAAPGANVSFEVYEKDTFSSDDFIRNFSALANAQGIATVSNFFITDADMQQGGINNGEPGYVQFYFVAKQATLSVQSELLYVNGTEGTNAPPNASISSPVHRGIYYNGTTILVNSSSTDDGPLTYAWTIAEDNFQSANQSFFYILKSPGQKTITLKVTDTKGLTSEAQVAIISIASPGALAFINQPYHLQTLVSSALWVGINASDSYVVNSTGTCPSIVLRCLAGNCPSQTQNAPAGCASTLPVLNPSQPFTSMYFDWSFNDGDAGIQHDGAGKAFVNKRFGLASNQAGDKRIDLTVNYTSASQNIALLRTTSRIFTLLDQHQCLNNGQTWVEYNATTGEIIATYSTLTTSRCAGNNQNVGDGDDCCPIGMTCTLNGCTNTNITICSDYTTKSSCNNDTAHVALNPNNPGWNDPPKCGEIVNGSVVACTCLWNGTSDSSGQCGLVKNSSASGGNPGECTPSSCYYPSTSLAGQCTNGYATINVNTQFTQGTCIGGIMASDCVSGPRTILCGKPSIALSFFGTWQFIASALFICVIYFLLHHRKKQ